MGHGAEPLDCTQFDSNGTCCDAVEIPGNLDLDAFQYNRVHEFMLLDFYASGAGAFGEDLLGNPSTVDSQLTLLPMIMDFSSSRPLEPILTNADIDVWNEDEVKFTNLHRCISCWDSEWMSLYVDGTPYPANFTIAVLGTDRGKARIRGAANAYCDRPPDPNASPPDPGHESQTAPLLGVVQKVIEWQGDGIGRAGYTLSGMGDRTDGVIKFETQGEPPESNAPPLPAGHDKEVQQGL